MENKSKCKIDKYDLMKLLLSISCIIIIVGLFYFQNMNTKLKHEYNQLSKLRLFNHSNETYEFIKFNFDLNYSMTGLVATNILCIEGDKYNHLLSDIVKQRPVLIYRFSENSCNPCYIEELDYLQSILTEKCNYIHLLCSYKYPRDLLVLRKSNNIKLPACLIPFDSFEWIAEESNKPYYFVLHPNMKISHIYVPDTDFPELNKQYLEGVKRFLSE